MKQIQLKYGQSSVEISVPPQSVIQELRPKQIAPIVDIKREINRVLDHPIGSKPFDELFAGGDSVVIVVSDVTRKIRTEQFLSVLVERLNQQGISDEEIIVVVATGTHRQASPEDRRTICGNEMYGRLQPVTHNCDADDLVYLGTTARGTKVAVNRLVVERKVLLTGGIAHHPLAGFTGGRKAVLPGVAGRGTIFQNHIHALDPDLPRLNPLASAGLIENNPVSLDMIDGAKLLDPDFLFNSMVNSKGDLARLAAGHWLDAWKVGCERVADDYEVPVAEKADLVIASCGGYPKDISFYQSTLSLFNAASAVKAGGRILLLAECREGPGPADFFCWNDALIRGNLDAEIREGFTVSGHIFYVAVESCKKAEVVLFSTIDPELVKPLGITATNSLAEAMRLAGTDAANTKTILMPDARATVPR